ARDDQTRSDFVFTDPPIDGNTMASYEGVDEEEGSFIFHVRYRLGEHDPRGLTSGRDASFGKIVLYGDGQRLWETEIAGLRGLVQESEDGLRTGSVDEPLLHRLELKVPEKELPEGKIMDAVLVFTDDRTQDARYHTQKDGIAKAPKMDSPVMMVAAGD